MTEELAASQDRYLRLAADFDNFRKRMARERTGIADRAQAAVLVRVLEVLDDLDRLVAEESAAAEARVLHDAIVMIDRKMRKELQSAGLESIIPDGEPFDPSLHEAVATLAAPDPAQDQHVAATFQAGYCFKGQLIRPARVQVYADQGEG